MLSDRNEKSEGFTKAEAGRVENMRFNRYRDVNPYDHSRVVLNGERAATDYINASLVKVRCRLLDHLVMQMQVNKSYSLGRGTS